MIDISPPEPPTLGTIDTFDSALGVAAAGTIVCVADGDSGLHVIDIADPSAPALLGTADTPGTAHDVALFGNHAYVAGRDLGLAIVDLGNPAAPFVAGSLDTPSRAFDVEISGTFAFVADLFSGLQVVDVSDPTAPAIVGSVNTPGRAVALELAGRYAYVADYEGGMHVIDISSPSSPAILGSTPLGSAVGIAVSGNYAFVADGDAGLRIFDVGNPSFPMLVTTVPTPDFAADVLVVSPYAYVALRDLGLQIFDVSAFFPILIGTALQALGPEDATMTGNLLLVASGQAGLFILPSQCGLPIPASAQAHPLHGVALGAWPNPARGDARLHFALARPASARIEIFDVRGRRLKLLWNGPVLAGTHTFVWDGHDDRGQRAAPGSYWVRSTSTTSHSAARFTLFPGR